MKKILGLITATTEAIAIMGLYLSATFVMIEFFLLFSRALIPFDYVLRSLTIGIILFTTSLFIKKRFPNRFAQTRITKLLGLPLSFSLGLMVLAYFDGEFGNFLYRATSTLEQEAMIHFLKSLSFVGVEILFLVVIPVLLLFDLAERNNLRLEKLFRLVAFLLVIFVFYILLKYENSGWEAIFVNRYVVPLVELIIGSLPLGWIYELYIGSIEKNEQRN